MTDFNNVYAQQLRVGDTLPEFELPITARLVVSTALASQDFQDVHHDNDAAIAKGTPDIFMNILTTCGLSARYLGDWAGAEARLEKISFNLLNPNFPGDTMAMEGEVIEVARTADAVRVAVSWDGMPRMEILPP